MSSLSALAERIVRHAGVSPEHLVVDVGAGGGLIARAVQAAGARVVAMDLDATVLRDAPGMRIAADIRRAPLRDGCFDRALTRAGLVWVADRAIAFDEIHRVLRPGGVLAGSEPLNAELSLAVDDADLRAIWDVFGEAVASLGEMTLTRDALRAGLREAGFVAIRIDVEEQLEADAYDLIMGLRPPGGATIAEHLVAGGFDPALVEGFADGVRRRGGSFVSRHAMFRGQRRVQGAASIMA